MARWLLWIGLAATLPVPLFVFAPARMPPLAYLELAGVCLITIAREGTGGVVVQLALVFLAHALVYLTLSWAAAWACTRLLQIAAPRAIGSITALALLAAVALCSTLAIYRTPFHAFTPTSTLLEVYR